MDEETTKLGPGSSFAKFLNQMTEELPGPTRNVKRETEKASELIYLASKDIILTTTDKFLREYDIRSEDYVRERPQLISVPVQETWDICMGAKVRIKSEFWDTERLEFVLKRTVGLRKEISKIKSCVGIVLSICNKFDSEVTVMFPDHSITANLYAGVIERTNDEPTVVIVSRFKKSDKVIIDASPDFVALQQRNYEFLSPGFHNKVGEVIAVTSRGVFVTFTGTFSVRVNPALLKFTEGNVQSYEFINSKNIFPGTEVRITGNLKKFMRETKKIAKWKMWMSKLPGEVVTTLLVKDNDKLRVCDRTGKSLNVHTSSVLVNDEVDEVEEDVPFKVNEWVKIKKTEHIKKILKSKTIPVAVLEYLDYPARVMNYKSKTKCGISYDSKYTICVSTFVLEKASVEEATLAQDIFLKAQKLDIGDEVYLRLGPPNYVRHTLSTNGFGEEVLNVVTKVAEIQGFIGFDKAVIKCSDGKLRKVNRELLTLPEKYSMKEKANLCSDLALVPKIVNKVEKSVFKIQERILDKQAQLHLSYPIQSIHFDLGQPSTLRLDIKTPLFDYKDLEQELQQDSTWKFAGQNDDEHIRVTEIESESIDLFVRFVFNITVTKDEAKGQSGVFKRRKLEELPVPQAAEDEQVSGIKA